MAEPNSIDKRPIFTLLSSFCAILLPLVLMGLAVIMACIIDIARVFVGVHYPGDIVGGALSGLLAGWIVTHLRRRLSSPTEAVIRFAQQIHLA